MVELVSRTCAGCGDVEGGADTSQFCFGRIQHDFQPPLDDHGRCTNPNCDSCERSRYIEEKIRREIELEQQGLVPTP